MAHSNLLSVRQSKILRYCLRFLQSRLLNYLYLLAQQKLLKVLLLPRVRKLPHKLGNLKVTAVALVFEEFLRRPVLEAVPSGLSSASTESLQVLVDLHGLGPQIGMLREIDSAARAIDFARLIELAPETLADALAAAGAAWFRDLIEDESFESQGYRIGYPVGAGAVELIRMVAEPPWLDAAQLVTLLDLSPAEQEAMGLNNGGGG